MSTEVRRAIVHYSNAATGSVRVKIPGVTGERAVPVSPQGLTYSGGVWSVPASGDFVMVAVEDNADVYWLSGYPSGLTTAEVQALVDAGTTGLATETYVDDAIDTALVTDWIRPTLLNGYSQGLLDSQYEQGLGVPFAYRKVGDMVQFQGVVDKSPPVENDIICTLPVGYRPVGKTPMQGHTGQGVIPIVCYANTNGDIEVGTSSTDTYSIYIRIYGGFSVNADPPA